MSQSEHEHERVTRQSGAPGAPGHHGGPVPVSEQPADDAATGDVSADGVDAAGAGHPNGLEPRAGRDS